MEFSPIILAACLELNRRLAHASSIRRGLLGGTMWVDYLTQYERIYDFPINRTTQVPCATRCLHGASSSSYTPPIKASLPSRPCVTSSCCTKSRAKCATWSRIHGAEYGKKKPYR